MKGQSSYTNGNNTSAYNYANYPQGNSGHQNSSQYYQAQQQQPPQQQQPQQASLQQPLQQQNQNVAVYSRSQSRHSHHQSENASTSGNSKHVKQPSTSQQYQQQQPPQPSQQGQTVYQQQQNTQLRENYNNPPQNTKIIPIVQAPSASLSASQTGGIRPSTVANILNNSSNSHVNTNVKQNTHQTSNPKVPTNENRITNISSNGAMNTVIQNVPVNPPSQQTSLKTGHTKASSAVKKRKAFECGGTTFCVDDNYEFCKQIGHGAYGVVCSGVDKKLNKKIAIKKITNAFEDLVDAKRILREIKMLKFFDHENIIALHDIIVPEQRTGYEDIYIVTELMETDLHRVIYSRQDLTDDHIQYFLYQTLRAMLYIHSANVMHRDLKPSNILVNKNCDLKVCDLGLARGFENDEDDSKTEYVVTRWYRAPEVILKASKYTKSIDVWSIGCIFAELLGRTPLFPGKDYLEQIQRIIAILGTPTQEEMSYISNDGALKYVKGLPKRTKQSWDILYPNTNPLGLDLLSKMLTFNPDDRYTVEKCLQHPYFEGLHNPEDEPTCPQPFDWAWDDFLLTKEKLQSMVYDEALSYQKVKPHQDILQNAAH